MTDQFQESIIKIFDIYIYLVFELNLDKLTFDFFLDSICVAAYMRNLQFLKSN